MLDCFTNAAPLLLVALAACGPCILVLVILASDDDDIGPDGCPA